MEQFRKLGLREDLLTLLNKKGITQPTDIQEKIIPEYLNSQKDIIGIAKTGTGKTASFALPLIQQLKPNKKVQAIIMTPTRELAQQVKTEIESLSPKHLRILAVYGGTPINKQIQELKRGIDIVVGTPGRIIDHLKRNTLSIKNVSTFILDEADEMLSMGFQEDIEMILSYTHDKKRVLLFSATMPKKILSITKNYMNNPITIKAKQTEEDYSLIDQSFHTIKHHKKSSHLQTLISQEQFFYGIVFCRTKADVDSLAKDLKQSNIKASAIHGDISQNKREKILRQFKEQKTHVLVATDVASRGIHVDNLTHVINFALPNDSESYIHRIGRTGRKGQKGKAISLITPREIRQIKAIEKNTGSTIKRETY